MSRMMILVIMTISTLCLRATAQEAAPLPLCRADVEGALACMANRACECVFAPAVPARGLPARYKWDCSLTRPTCNVVPESLALPPELPLAVGQSNDQTSIITGNSDQ